MSVNRTVPFSTLTFSLLNIWGSALPILISVIFFLYLSKTDWNCLSTSFSMADGFISSTSAEFLALLLDVNDVPLKGLHNKDWRRGVLLAANFSPIMTGNGQCNFSANAEN
ncbi:hypothetical protein OGATHE_001382 [Ogataea polymorpha]|uniref:Uncharacterized protein n=1 Tax=Ogataea polymorpha TaxID=460523 RepID=A0A9P8PRC2_9ASCO|nr:hypothetical protein OGATHE_001382 [Ogataea polymorpha]